MEKEELSDLLFWKRKLDKVGRFGAYLLLTKDDEEMLYLEAKYLTAFMRIHSYVTIHLISDRQSVIDKMLEKTDIFCDTEVIPAEKLKKLYYIENAFGIFRRIYSDVSMPMSDGDFYKLVGYDGITIRDIVCYVVLRLDSIPTEEDIVDSDEWEQNNRSCWKSLLDTRRIIATFDFKPNYDIVRDQREVIDADGRFAKKNIYLYADSEVARWCLDIYRDCKIVGIIDRDLSKVGRYVDGVPVYGLEKLENINCNKDIVLVTNRRCEEIIISLVKKGFIVGKNLFAINPRPDIVDWSDEQVKEYISGELANGQKFFSRLRSDYPKEKFLLSPWNASGDIYVTGLYLDQYVTENCDDGYKLFMTSLAGSKIANALGYKTEIVDEDSMMSLLTYVRYIGFDKANAINTNFNYPSRFEAQRVSNIYHIMDFNTGHQRMVYDSDVKKTRISLKQKQSSLIFERENLSLDRTILIAPYSNTLGCIPDGVCSELVKCLKKKGYSVCTNIAGEEKPIEGTIGLFLPYDVVLDFTNKCAGVIGMRSGLFDVISSSDTKMVVYYVKDFERYFSLKQMGLKINNIIEMNTTDSSWNELIDKTISFFE